MLKTNYNKNRKSYIHELLKPSIEIRSIDTHQQYTALLLNITTNQGG